MGNTKFVNDLAEDIRVRGLYRKLVLEGGISLPYNSLKGLIGPDCAYHLYRFDRGSGSDIICLKSERKGRK